MRTISVSEFKARCLKLFLDVERTGRSILITKRGEPIAMVTPPPPESRSRTGRGSMKGTVEILGDITEPLGTDDWEVSKANEITPGHACVDMVAPGLLKSDARGY